MNKRPKDFTTVFVVGRKYRLYYDNGPNMQIWSDVRVVRLSSSMIHGEILGRSRHGADDQIGKIRTYSNFDGWDELPIKKGKTMDEILTISLTPAQLKRLRKALENEGVIPKERPLLVGDMWTNKDSPEKAQIEAILPAQRGFPVEVVYSVSGEWSRRIHSEDQFREAFDPPVRK